VIYPGGKNQSGVYQRLINLMPPHRVYVEPFLGSGAVIFHKRPASITIGIDRSERVISDFKIRAGPGPKRPLIAALDDSGEDAGVICGDDGTRGWLRLIVGDGIDFLESYEWEGDEMVYCDPPYLPETRLSQKPLFDYELNKAQHRRLLKVLDSLPCFVMLSGYWSKLYDNTLRNPNRQNDWHMDSFQALTRGGPAQEYLWMNYPPPVELHDYNYLGATFRERERIKKKIRRWQRRLAAMPMLERQAMLAAIQRHADEDGTDGGLMVDRCQTA
jgi:hypothetical protein